MREVLQITLVDGPLFEWTLWSLAALLGCGHRRPWHRMAGRGYLAGPLTCRDAGPEGERGVAREHIGRETAVRECDYTVTMG